METEIVSMTAAMLNGNRETVGFLTSGGTESNLMAVKTFRDRARKLHPNITSPNIVSIIIAVVVLVFCVSFFFSKYCSIFPGRGEWG